MPRSCRRGPGLPRAPPAEARGRRDAPTLPPPPCGSPAPDTRGAPPPARVTWGRAEGGDSQSERPQVRRCTPGVVVRSTSAGRRREARAPAAGRSPHHRRGLPGQGLRAAPASPASLSSKGKACAGSLYGLLSPALASALQKPGVEAEACRPALPAGCLQAAFAGSAGVEGRTHGVCVPAGTGRGPGNTVVLSWGTFLVAMTTSTSVLPESRVKSVKRCQKVGIGIKWGITGLTGIRKQHFSFPA